MMGVGSTYRTLCPPWICLRPSSDQAFIWVSTLAVAERFDGSTEAIRAFDPSVT